MPQRVDDCTIVLPEWTDMGACELKVYDELILGVPVVDSDDEHQENESEKVPEEARAKSFQEVYAENKARCGKNPNGKRLSRKKQAWEKQGFTQKEVRPRHVGCPPAYFFNRITLIATFRRSRSGSFKRAFSA